jgi:translation initiation factor 2 alpha subunit (eIF-2alpha)
MRGIITLKSYASDGLQKIKAVLATLQAQTFDDATFELHYVSAPTYHVTVDADSYKRAEKILDHMAKLLDENARGAEFESGLEIQKA